MSETVEDVMVRLDEFSTASLGVEIRRSPAVAGGHIATARLAGWVIQISRVPTRYRVSGVPPLPVAAGASEERIRQLQSLFARTPARDVVAEGYCFPTEEQWVDHFDMHPELMGELIKNVVLESKLADPAVPRRMGRRPKDGSLLGRADVWTYLPHRFASLLLDGGG